VLDMYTGSEYAAQIIVLWASRKKGQIRSKVPYAASLMLTV